MSVTRARHPLNRIAALVLLVFLFVSVNVIAALSLRGHQLDLTENKLYTLSNGTRSVLEQLNEPVRLRLFYSRNQAGDYPPLRVYAERVRALLQTFSENSQGRLIVQTIEPAPYSEDEDIALALGLTPIAGDSGTPFYFGLVGTNAADGREIIPFLNPVREQYLEYDLARLIHALSEPGRARLGVITTLPLAGVEGGQFSAPMRLAPSLIYKALDESFVIEMLASNIKRIPSDIGVLLIAHPGNLEEDTLYAIDQFVLRGGRAVIFIDPLSERSFDNPGLAASSNLSRLFKAWGVQMMTGKVVGDREHALLVRAPAQPGDAQQIQPIIDYVAWLGMNESDFAKGDLALQGIDQINLASAGALIPVEGAKSLFTPIITSGRDAMLLDTSKLGAAPDPAALLRDFKSAQQRFTLAARISGRVMSAFPGGRAPASTSQVLAPQPAQASVPAETASAQTDVQVAHIDVPRGPANILIIADTDILDDRFWIQSTESYLGQDFSTPSADNAKFIVSAIENLMGSNALISLRARERANRPFVVVQKRRREAEKNYLAQEEKLRADIRTTESRLADFQNQNPGRGDTAPLLSAAEQSEIARFKDELLKTRQSLREVQHNLNKDIEALGSRLRLINIFLMPVCVAVVGAIFIFLSRRRRKQAARRLERALVRHGQANTNMLPVAVPARAAAVPTVDLQQMGSEEAAQLSVVSTAAQPILSLPHEDGGSPTEEAQESEINLSGDIADRPESLVDMQDVEENSETPAEETDNAVSIDDNDKKDGEK